MVGEGPIGPRHICKKGSLASVSLLKTHIGVSWSVTILTHIRIVKLGFIIKLGPIIKLSSPSNRKPRLVNNSGSEDSAFSESPFVIVIPLSVVSS